MSVTVCVEGGGDSRDLRKKCRKGFSEFFRKAGLSGRMPRIIPGGGRDNTFQDFRDALAGNTDRAFVVLLVDSESPVSDSHGAWSHLQRRDGWAPPAGATDENTHLMVQCMEAWFLADRDTLARFFGTGFNENALPRRSDVENVSKDDLLRGIENATRRCTPKGRYEKGRHSFQILERLNPERVTASSPYAKRLIDTLKDRAADGE